MTKQLVASFVAIGLLAGSTAAAATTTKPQTEKAKPHKAHAKPKLSAKADQPKAPKTK